MAYYEYEFPQQKIFEVKDLPLTNNSNMIYIDSEKPLQKNRPKIKPQKVVFLFSVEWMWSPAHNRIDSYFINVKPSQYYLWNCFPDPHSFSDYWDFVGYTDNKKGDLYDIWTTISIYLINENISDENINGISISPKKNFCIIKIWTKNNNTDITKINKIENISYDGIIFKAHSV